MQGHLYKALLYKNIQKVGKERPKPPGFTMPHYFYVYNISSNDFDAI
jgi:hypothetical protein